MLIGKILLPIVLLCAIAVAIFYVRLLNGPIAINFLTAPIAAAINAELGDLTVKVDQAIIQLEGRHLALQLKNVTLFDKAMVPVAVAPLAAIEVSRKALWAGRISPSRIVLLEPRLLLFYSPEKGLSLRFSREQPAAKSFKSSELLGRKKTSPPSGTKTAPLVRKFGGSDPDTDFERIDLAATIAKLAQSARRQRNATSYFDNFGMRNATVILDYAGTQTAWRVPSADINLAHFNQSSILSGLINVASSRGMWRIALRAEESERTHTVKLRASVRDVFLGSIAEAVDGLPALRMMQFPISLEADLSLSTEGEVLAGNVQMELGAGHLALPTLSGIAPRFSSGRLGLSYRRGQKHLVLESSTLRWANSEMTALGTIQPPEPGSVDGIWSYDLKAIRGSLSFEDAASGGGAVPGSAQRVAVRHWSAKGRFRPQDSVVLLDRVVMQTDKSGAVMSGRLFVGERPGYALAGTFGAMSARSLLLYWPNFLAGKARDWASVHLQAGKMSGGRFKASYRASPALPQGVITPGPASVRVTTQPLRVTWSTSLNLDFKDVAFLPDPLLPPVYAPRATVSLVDDRLDVDIGKAEFSVGQKKAVSIKSLRMTADKIYGDKADGQLSLRLTGRLSDALAMTDNRPFGIAPFPLPIRKKLSGNFDARLDVVVPLARAGGQKLPLPRVSGQVRILNGRAQRLVAGKTISDAAVLFDLAEKSINARGKMLVSGIPVALSWQYIVGAEASKQPPLRLTTTLDNAARDALEMNINHMVQGKVGVVATWIPQWALSSPLSGGVHVHADLTKADVTLESIAWHKPSGRQAVLDLDIVSRDGKAGKLENIRVAGGGIAITGSAELGADYRIKSFDLPEFSVNVVTRLRVKGERRKNNVWRVSVRGQTYEGQNLFRSLFSAGQVNAGASAGTRSIMKQGIDLDVRVANVLGFWNTSMKDVLLEFSKRNGKIMALTAHGTLKSGKKLIVQVQKAPPGKPRKLVAFTGDAGAAFQLVGFYPNARGGRMQLVVNLDGAGAATKTGLLYVEDFRVLGDPVLSEVIYSPDDGSQPSRSKRRRTVREVTAFDWMRIPFSVGHGQFVLNEAELRGAVVGAVLRGKANFNTRSLNLGGTYVPLQGLNAALGVIPGLGQLIAGPRGEGILGVTFAVRGPMSNPQILVNPLSLVAPGIFREMFQMTEPAPRIIPNRKSGLGGESKTRTRGRSSGSKGWRSRTFGGDGGD